MKLRMRHLEKTFRTRRGVVHALRNINLEIEDGEFFIFLGPSGCGKSTLLNCVSGLEKPTGGEILFGEERVAAPELGILKPTRKRDVAMVFQSYALYPHMSVYENIAFPLKIAKKGKAEIDRSVRDTAAMLGIENLLDRKPGELSGGQRQRVAISRALVRRPKLFLLDEPLSNLDARLRIAMRAELKQLQREIGITTLYVTHDQTEAMSLGDRVALLNDGEIVQVDTPIDLYDRPRTLFAAGFIGSPPMNLMAAELRKKSLRIAGVEIGLSGQIEEQTRALPPGKVVIGIRPQDLGLVAPADGNAVLRGRIGTVEPMGSEVLYHFLPETGDAGKEKMKNGVGELIVLTSNRNIRSGDTMGLVMNASAIRLYDPESGKAARG